MKNNLYVGNLAYSVDDLVLQEAFVPYGTVKSARVITDRDSGRSKGFGFVEMSTDEEAAKAIEALHDKELDGRRMNVNIARPKEDNRGGGGGGRGPSSDFGDRPPRRSSREHRDDRRA